MEKVKFVTITRTICPKGKTHYLDAVDTEGQIWFAEMRTDVESWITYSVPWKKAGQQPYNQ